MEEEKQIAVIEQLPKITQRLEEVSKEIKDKTDKAINLVVTEDNLQDIKKVRADLNKQFAQYEDVRKTIKKKIMEKYDEFENQYDVLIRNAFKNAEDSLKSKINAEEYKIKVQKEKTLIFYFNEYLDYLHLNDIISWEQLDIKVNMSDSEKKLREQVKSKLDSIANDIKLIELEEYSGDIMLEYSNNGFDFAKAKLTIVNRIKEKQRLEEERLKREQLQKQEQVIEQKVEEEIVVPVEVVEKPVDNILSTRFEVHATKEKLVNLKKYMTDNEILFFSI